MKNRRKASLVQIGTSKCRSDGDLKRVNLFQLPNLYTPSISLKLRSQKFQIMIAREPGQSESPESRAKLNSCSWVSLAYSELCCLTPHLGTLSRTSASQRSLHVYSVFAGTLVELKRTLEKLLPWLAEPRRPHLGHSVHLCTHPTLSPQGQRAWEVQHVWGVTSERHCCFFVVVNVMSLNGCTPQADPPSPSQAAFFPVVYVSRAPLQS